MRPVGVCVCVCVFRYVVVICDMCNEEGLKYIPHFHPSPPSPPHTLTSSHPHSHIMVIMCVVCVCPVTGGGSNGGVEEGVRGEGAAV